MMAWKRMIVVFLSSCGLAAFFGAFANVANLHIGVVYGIGAVLVAGVAFFGVPWALIVRGSAE